MPAVGSSGPVAATPTPAIGAGAAARDRWPPARRSAPPPPSGPPPGVGSAAKPRTAPAVVDQRGAQLGPAEIDRQRGPRHRRSGSSACSQAIRAAQVRVAEGERAEHHRLGPGGAQQRHRLSSRMPPSAARTRRAGGSIRRAARSRSQAPVGRAPGPSRRSPCRAASRRRPRRGRGERLDRRLQPQHHAGRRAEPAREPRRAQPGRAVLGMHADEVGAGLDELAHLGVEDRPPRPSGARGSGGASARRSARRGRERTGRPARSGRRPRRRGAGRRSGSTRSSSALEVGEIGRPQRKLRQHPVARQRGDRLGAREAHPCPPRGLAGRNRPIAARTSPACRAAVVGLRRHLDETRARDGGGEAARPARADARRPGIADHQRRDREAPPPRPRERRVRRRRCRRAPRRSRRHPAGRSSRAATRGCPAPRGRGARRSPIRRRPPAPRRAVRPSSSRPTSRDRGEVRRRRRRSPRPGGPAPAPPTRPGWRTARRSAIAAPIEMPPRGEAADPRGIGRGEHVVGEHREAERPDAAERRAAVAAAFERDPPPAAVVGKDLARPAPRRRRGRAGRRPPGRRPRRRPRGRRRRGAAAAGHPSHTRLREMARDRRRLVGREAVRDERPVEARRPQPGDEVAKVDDALPGGDEPARRRRGPWRAPWRHGRRVASTARGDDARAPRRRSARSKRLAGSSTMRSRCEPISAISRTRVGGEVTTLACSGSMPRSTPWRSARSSACPISAAMSAQADRIGVVRMMAPTGRRGRGCRCRA